MELEKIIKERLQYGKIKTEDGLDYIGFQMHKSNPIGKWNEEVNNENLKLINKFSDLLDSEFLNKRFDCWKGTCFLSKEDITSFEVCNQKDDLLMDFTAWESWKIMEWLIQNYPKNDKNINNFDFNKLESFHQFKLLLDREYINIPWSKNSIKLMDSWSDEVEKEEGELPIQKTLFPDKIRSLINKEIKDDNLKKFFLGKDLIKLFIKTNNKIYARKTPFFSFYLDFKNLINFPFIKGGLIISPLNNILYDEHTQIIYFKEHPIKFNEITKKWDKEWKLEIDFLFKKEKNIKSDIEIIKKQICNFLDFINHEDVEIKNIKRTEEQNIKRMNRGKIPIPNFSYINIKGKLKKYIYETQKRNEKLWELGHRFWVRGHWVNFTSDRYKNKKGQKTWILPYIKGTGELKNKSYYLGERERCWANERRMKELIQIIYPDKELKNNDRTTLNGLEIDCYVPELKIGFEYNGEQHYNHIKIFHKTEKEFAAQKERDIEKNKRAKELGINLITIKYDEELSEDLIRSKL